MPRISKEKSAFEKFKGVKKIQQVALGVAAFVILSVSGLGVYSYGYSSAAKNSSSAIMANGMGFSPAGGRLAAGSKLSVTIVANSGTVPVNAVQAKVNYDAGRLEYTGMQETGVFEQVAANETSVPGTVRIARAAAVPVTGTNSVVTLLFTVKPGSNGSTAISLDPASSYLVDAAASTNILKTLYQASFTIRNR